MSHINDAQKHMLVEFMSIHPELRSGKFTTQFTVKKAQLLWEDISNALNSVPNGAEKDWKKWRKTWQDMKKNAKGKNATVKKYMEGTGGGSAPKVLSELESNILDLTPRQQIEGLGVGKSVVEFSFENEKNICELEGDIENKIDSAPTPSVSAEKPTEVEVAEVEVTGTQAEHDYNMKFPNTRTPKRTSKSTRLESSIQLTQKYINQVEQKNEMQTMYNTQVLINSNMNLRRKIRDSKNSNAWWRHLKH